MSVKDIACKMIRTSIIHRRVAENCLSDLGIYQGQHRMLMELSKNDKISQKQLSDIMKVSTATVAIGVQKLEKGGFITKSSDISDGRYNKITITEKGRKVVDDSEKVFESIDAAIFTGFSDEELKVFEKCLGMVEDNLLKYEKEKKKYPN